MLVSGGVEHDLGTVVVEYAIHAGHVPYRGDLHAEIQRVPVFTDQLLLDAVGVVLVDIQYDESGGAEGGDLTAQLGANGAAAARNQNHLARIVASQLVQVDLICQGFATQKLLDLELAHRAAVTRVSLRARDITGGEIVHLDLVAGLTVELDETAALLGRDVGNGQEDLLDGEGGQSVQNEFVLAVHLEISHPHADLFLTVVNEADRIVSGGGIDAKLLGQMASDLTGTHDGDTDLVQVAEIPADARPLVAELVHQLVAKAQGQGAQRKEGQHAEGLPEINVYVAQVVNPQMSQYVGQKVGNAAAAQIRDHQGHVGADVGIPPHVAVSLAYQTSRDHEDQEEQQVLPAIEPVIHIIFQSDGTEQRVDHIGAAEAQDVNRAQKNAAVDASEQGNTGTAGRRALGLCLVGGGHLIIGFRGIHRVNLLRLCWGLRNG